MVSTQFINVLCTKQICLAPGCRTFCSAKIKFHAFEYSAAWKHFCLKPSVLHLISYLFHNPHNLFVFLSLINSTLPETHLLLPSCPSPLLPQLWRRRTLHPRSTCEENSNPILQHLLMSKRVSITQWGQSRPSSDIMSFIWQFSSHWGHKLTQNSAFREGQWSVASPAL